MNVLIQLDRRLINELDRSEKGKITVAYQMKDMTDESEYCEAITEHGEFRILQQDKVKAVSRHKKGVIYRKDRKILLKTGTAAMPPWWVWLLILTGMAALITGALVLKSCNAAEAAHPDGSTGGTGDIQVETSITTEDLLIGEGEVNYGGIDWGGLEGNEENELSFSVNAAPVVSKSTGTGNFVIVNPEINKLSIVAEIFLKDGKDTLVYRSPLMPPGSHIKEAKTAVSLEKGEYEAICYLKGVMTGDEPGHVGTVGVDIVIEVR